MPLLQDACTPLLDGPYLHLAAVPQWGPACVVAHRKASDEHVRIVLLGGGGEAGQDDGPCEVMVTDDSTRIALPSAPGGGDNFVVGLAMDTSCDVVCDLKGGDLRGRTLPCRMTHTCKLSASPFPYRQGPIPHPMNPDAKDLVPTPLLLVATTDGVLRFYCFGHVKKQQVLTTVPEPVPTQLPSALLDSARAASAASGAGAVPQQGGPPALGGDSLGATMAGFAALPQAAVEAAAAKAALPDDDDDDFGSDEGESDLQGEQMNITVKCFIPPTHSMHPHILCTQYILFRSLCSIDVTASHHCPACKQSSRDLPCSTTGSIWLRALAGRWTFGCAGLRRSGGH